MKCQTWVPRPWTSSCKRRCQIWCIQTRSRDIPIVCVFDVFHWLLLLLLFIIRVVTYSGKYGNLAKSGEYKGDHGTVQSINQSKHISIAPYVASKSEAVGEKAKRVEGKVVRFVLSWEFCVFQATSNVISYLLVENCSCNCCLWEEVLFLFCT